MEFGVPMKIKMYLDEAFSEVFIGKSLFDNFPIEMV
jgi:hypothetical protein